MLRFAVPLLLLLVSHSAYAQASDAGLRDSAAEISSADAAPRTVVFRASIDPRLLPERAAREWLTVPFSAPQPQRPGAGRNRWKTGAVIGGVLGGVAGFGVGLTMENIINEGEWRVGEGAFGGAAVGAVVGALLGAGVGALTGD